MTTRQSVLVVRTGTANTASVLSGLARAGADPRLCDDPREIERADRVCLPGVGAFAAAAVHLAGSGASRPLLERIRSGKPTLAICLGLQLLGDASDESPGVAGLSVFRGRAERFPSTTTVRVPQMGWNEVAAEDGCRFLRSGHAYFANSYRFASAPEGWRAAISDHAGPFVAAIERNGVLACQFHPELSGAFGLALLERWIGQSC